MKPLSERLKDFPNAQFVDWLCLACVDVREVRTPDDAQEEINKIRDAVTGRLASLMQRAEAAEARLAQREKLDEEAMHCATILEFIGNFESDDIDGDLVDLRFEIDGEDTGCDVSITEYALRSASAIRSILSGASISRPAPAADRVPEGWKLAPVEPTEEMIAAGDQFMDGLSSLGDAYDAMLAAAPTPSE